VRRALIALGLVAALAGGCGGDEDETSGASDEGKPQLVVSAASSMTEALTACSKGYPDAELKLQFAGSDELAAQIRQGVKPDVFAAASTRLPDELHSEGLLSKPVVFATNEFVLAVPDGSDITGLDDLEAPGVKIAIGSESVPIGEYTRESLAKLPPAQEKAILANVRSNEPDVKGIVGKLTQGAADAGFVYVTDVEATDGALKAIELPAKLEPNATYGAGVVEGAKEPNAPQAFVEGLVDGDCADALRAAGFGASPG
jgi:molybdate transport system substrate-binding protein